MTALVTHPTHVVRIPAVGRFARQGDKWRARCSNDECRWQGPAWLDSAHARRDGQEHTASHQEREQ